MTEYLIHKKGDPENNIYTSFDDVAPLLKESDIVTFSPGIHQYKGAGLKVDQLTIRGQIPKAYEKTVIVMLPNDNYPEKIIINENGGIAIENISIVSGPKVLPIAYKDNASIIVKDSNIVWNHFKLKDLEDNFNLIAPLDPKNILNTVSVESSVLSSVDLVAKTLKFEKTVIGSPYGEESYLSGLAQDSSHVFLMNTDLGLAGDVYSFNMVDNVTIVDIDENLVNKYPNISDAPFIINNLLFKLRNVKATRVLQTWDKVAENLYQKQLRSNKKNNNKNYYLKNERKMNPVYLIVDPKGKGKRYSLPHDKSLFINYGKAVITGENNSKTAWPNEQAGGELVLINYKSGIPFNYSGGDVFISNSILPELKKHTPLKSNIEQPTFDITIPSISQSDLASYLLTQNELEEIERRKTPVYDILSDNLDNWLMSGSNPPIVVVTGVERLSLIRQMEMFVSDAYSRGLIKHEQVVRIEDALKLQKPSDLKEALIGHLGKLWVNLNVSSLLTNPNGSQWLNFYHNLLSNPDRKTMIVLYDSPENIEQVYNRFPALNKIAKKIEISKNPKLI